MIGLCAPYARCRYENHLRLKAIIQEVLLQEVLHQERREKHDNDDVAPSGLRLMSPNRRRTAETAKSAKSLAYRYRHHYVGHN